MPTGKRFKQVPEKDIEHAVGKHFRPAHLKVPTQLDVGFWDSQDDDALLPQEEEPLDAADELAAEVSTAPDEPLDASDITDDDLLAQEPIPELADTELPDDADLEEKDLEEADLEEDLEDEEFENEDLGDEDLEDEDLYLDIDLDDTNVPNALWEQAPDDLTVQTGPAEASAQPKTISPYEEMAGTRPKRRVILVAACACAILAFLGLCITVIPALLSDQTPTQAGPASGSSSNAATRPNGDEVTNDQDSKQADSSKSHKTKQTKVHKLSHKLKGNAADIATNSEAYGEMTQAIGKLEDAEFNVAFVLHDINTGVEVRYDANTIYYPASSIKGPYVTSLYEELADNGTANLDDLYKLAEPTILLSDNDAYTALHNMYGETAFQTWLEDAGLEIDPYGIKTELGAWHYPHICAKQLEAMWLHIYDYLTEDQSKASKQLAKLFEKREQSAMRDALGKDVRTWSKAGWFFTDEAPVASKSATEAGVVFSDAGPYVVAIMSTSPGELEDIEPLFKALDELHEDLVAQHVFASFLSDMGFQNS